nr:hypothetical protein [Tanacetum cinerariifolium]
MGYEKPSIKLTFYKAFFSRQWKFLIHTILQSLSAKRTSWNEFSFAMASAIICLSTVRKLKFSKYIFDSLVKNVDSSSKFYMYPRFIQLIIQNQLDDLSTHITKYTSPALTQKVFANMRRVGKGFLGVETPLFEGMLVVRENVVEGVADEQVQEDDVAAAAPEDVPAAPQPQARPQAADFPLGLLQTALDTCAALTNRIEQLESDKPSQALEITQLKKRVKRLEKGQKVKVFKLRRLKKGRMIVELDRDVELMGEKEEEKKTEQSKDIADDVQVERRQAEIQAEIYHIDLGHPSKVLLMKKRPQTEAQAHKNMITYLKNTAGFRLDYFKGLSYDDIRLIFKAKFNTNIEFLLKSKEQMEEEEKRAIESINETSAQKAAKRRKLRMLKISNSIWRLCLMKTTMYIHRLLHLLGRSLLWIIRSFS